MEDYSGLENGPIVDFAFLNQDIVVVKSPTEYLVVEKSALVPMGHSKPRWEEAVITPCGAIDVPAEPEKFNFAWCTVMMLVDDNYAIWRVQRGIEWQRVMGPKLKEMRERAGLSIGKVAELSGVCGESIAAMEAGAHAYPGKIFWTVTVCIVKHRKRRSKPV